MQEALPVWAGSCHIACPGSCHRQASCIPATRWKPPLQAPKRCGCWQRFLAACSSWIQLGSLPNHPSSQNWLERDSQASDPAASEPALSHPPHPGTVGVSLLCQVCSHLLSLSGGFLDDFPGFYWGGVHRYGCCLLLLTKKPSSSSCRLVHSGSGRRSPCMGSDLSFATRTGCRQGIAMHIFRVETHRDLSSWTRILVQGCHAAAELVKEVSLGKWPAALPL